jgi:hypothetical protein
VPGNDGSFVWCGLHELPLPALVLQTGPDEAGTFTLAWGAIGGADHYEIEESPDPLFARGVTTYSTTTHQLVVYGHSPGVIYMRARALAGSLDSGWSAAISISVSVGSDWIVPDFPAGSPLQASSAAANPAPALLDVQRAMLRVCAARGDLFALLSLPASHTAADAALYVTNLRALESSTTLGYGAAYHPWLVVRDIPTGPLRTTPPDGAIAGMYALRAIGRGAWVAPANEPLASLVLGLSPPFPDDVWSVLDAQPVNRIRPEAHGLLPMSADTLSDDPNLGLVNVRRLLMLLRRAALSLGNTYVFEPNGPVLARSVGGTFASLLGDLFRRGAFAGASDDQAYRVVTDASVNPPESVDQGRFVVELQVAPSSPLAFLTVRLVQTGDRLSVSGS